MKKMKKVLATTFSMCLLLTNSMTLFAQETGAATESGLAEGPVTGDEVREERKDPAASMTEIDSGSMGYVDINECEELIPESLESKEFNRMGRSHTGFQTQIENIPSESDIAAYADYDNTDPNYAYIVENDVVMQGTIQAEEEARWYAFILDEKSKATILLQMVESLDADIYLFQLNGTQLDLIGGSAISGGGIQEYCTQVLESGTYFFAVSGYSGTGNFAFAYYQSSLDASYEINDTKEMATSVDTTAAVRGVIDHPYDMDYYKITVDTSMIFSYSFGSSNGYVFGYAGSEGGYTPTAIDANTLYLSSGTYYFAVYSPDDLYSANSSYTINFRKIANMASTYAAPIVGIHKEAGIVYQTNSTGSAYYVNGNEIDINYRWQLEASNSAGMQSYDVKLRGGNDITAILSTDNYGPRAVWYHSSTRPNYGVSGRPALSLTFTGPRGFYYVHCRCTGAYAMNNLWEDFSAVNVIIDPETGKMIDIYEFNYFYDYAEGSNSILVLGSYYKDQIKFYDFG